MLRRLLLAAPLLVALPASAQDIFLDDPEAPAAERVAQPEGFPIELERARRIFALLRELSAADDAALWGVAIEGPLLIVDRASRAVVGNAPDREGRLREAAEGIWIGALPEEVNFGNTTVVWAGRLWSMIVWPLADDPRFVGPLVMHERFHAVQPDLGIPLENPGNLHLEQPEGRAWLRLEMRALAAAIAPADDPDGDGVDLEAAADALLFRARRRVGNREMAKGENALELNEGLAEDTGLRLGGIGEVERRARAEGGLRGTDGTGPLVRTFAYATGPAYGLLLDAVADPAWRREVRAGNDLGRMLARAMRWRPPSGRAGLESAAEERGAAYGLPAVVAEEDERAAARTARAAELRATFVDGPILAIPMTGSFNYTFSPWNIEGLDDVGTLYGTMRLSGPWGILDAKEGALVVADRRGRRTVIVPAPEDPAARPLAGPGWTLELTGAWTIEEGPRRGDRRLVPPG